MYISDFLVRIFRIREEFFCEVCTCMVVYVWLSEPGFSGFQDFQDKRRGFWWLYTCMDVYMYTRIFLNQDFQDFRIFRIREESLVGVYVYTCIRVCTFRPAGAAGRRAGRPRPYEGVGGGFLSEP